VPTPDVVCPSIPVNTLRPKKNGRPKSKKLPPKVPATSEKALLPVAASASALATLKKTSPLALPSRPVLIAPSSRPAGGQ